MSDEHRSKDHQEQGRAFEACRDAGSVSEACKVHGLLPGQLLPLKELYDKGGELALKEISRRKPVLKNRVEPATEQAVTEMAIEQPAWAQVPWRINSGSEVRLSRRRGVRSARARNDLPTFARRLKASEARLAQNWGMALTEPQIRAMTRCPAPDACGAGLVAK